VVYDGNVANWKIEMTGNIANTGGSSCRNDRVIVRLRWLER